jgi:hypothetical protein
VLLAFVGRPRGFAGHRAALAGDATIDVEYKSELPFRKSRFVGILHLAAKLPIPNFGHGFLLFQF